MRTPRSQVPIPWALRPVSDSDQLSALCRESNIHPLVGQILLRRGIVDPEPALKFLQPRLENLYDPFQLHGMEAAVERIISALEKGERIVVSGDYDVDGMTSSALLADFLTQAGCTDLEVFIPNRFDHGYGLTARTVEALQALKPQLVVTVDNGITAIEEVAQLQASGVDTIITDHHLPRDAGVPPGVVVNPRQSICSYPFEGISGVGVAFKLVSALRKVLRDKGWWNDARPEPNLKDALDLVAIGTVADVVPLLDENRVLVAHGLDVLNRPNRRPGIAALAEVARARDPLSARTIAFQLAPRLNAAGRMQEGSLGVALLRSKDPQEAAQLAQRLDEENSKRREREDEMVRDALVQIREEDLDQQSAIVVASPNFHEGIIGIVAARLVERYQRPAVVLAENSGGLKGSIRSVPGVHVTEALNACADLLPEYGGHAGAAGCKLDMVDLEQFRKRFSEACAGQAGSNGGVEPLWLEGRLDPATLDGSLVEQLQQLEPFGQENDRPLFLLETSAIPEEPKKIGENHLKWILPGGAEMVAWKKAGKINPGDDLQFRVSLGFNEFRGVRKVQLTVEDFRPTAPLV